MSVGAPSVRLEWTDPRLSTEPAAVLAPIRELGPVVYNEAQDEWMITTYAVGAEILAASDRFNISSLEPLFYALFGGMTMGGVDDKKRHAELRGVWAGAFRRSTLESQQELVETVIDSSLGGLFERLRAGETVDAITGGVRSVPTLVIAHLLGLDPAMHDEFTALSDAQIALVAASMDHSPAGQAQLQAGKEATDRMNELMAEEIELRRAQPTEDLISLMAQSDVGLSDRDLIASVTQLVLAGNETTARLMGHALIVLAAYPDQRKRLREDRSLVRPAIEELLRYETVVQWFTRQANEDTELAGVQVPGGATVAIMAGAANRDPDRWDDPDVYDIGRPPQNHLGFSFGMHSCLGLNLSRLEMDVYLNRLLDGVADWDLAEQPDYGKAFPIRGPERVMIAAA